MTHKPSTNQMPKAQKTLIYTLLVFVNTAGCTPDTAPDNSHSDTDVEVERLIVSRTTDQITLEDTQTVEWDDASFVLNFYRNKAYTCGLSGD